MLTAWSLLGILSLSAPHLLSLKINKKNIKGKKGSDTSPSSPFTPEGTRKPSLPWISLSKILSFCLIQMETPRPLCCSFFLPGCVVVYLPSHLSLLPRQPSYIRAFQHPPRPFLSSPSPLLLFPEQDGCTHLTIYPTWNILPR